MMMSPPRLQVLRTVLRTVLLICSIRFDLFLSDSSGFPVLQGVFAVVGGGGYPDSSPVVAGSGGYPDNSSENNKELTPSHEEDTSSGARTSSQPAGFVLSSPEVDVEQPRSGRSEEQPSGLGHEIMNKGRITVHTLGGTRITKYLLRDERGNIQVPDIEKAFGFRRGTGYGEGHLRVLGFL